MAAPKVGRRLGIGGGEHAAPDRAGLRLLACVAAAAPALAVVPGPALGHHARRHVQAVALTLHARQATPEPVPGMHGHAQPLATHQRLQGRFLFLGSGYYDYDDPYDAGFKGRDKFKGTIIHPQFWPKDFDHTG